MSSAFRISISEEQRMVLYHAVCELMKHSPEDETVHDLHGLLLSLPYNESTTPNAVHDFAS